MALTAVGLLMLVFLSAATLSPYILGIALLIFSVVIGRVRITSQYASEFPTSTRIAFSVFAMWCVFGISASLARGRVRRAGE